MGGALNGTDDNSATAEAVLSKLTSDLDARIEAAVAVGVATAMKQYHAVMKARLALVTETAVARELECTRLSARCAELEQGLQRAHRRCETLEAGLQGPDSEKAHTAQYEDLKLDAERADLRYDALEAKLASVTKASETAESKHAKERAKLECSLAAAAEQRTSLESDLASFKEAATATETRLAERCTELEASLASTSEKLGEQIAALLRDNSRLNAWHGSMKTSLLREKKEAAADNGKRAWVLGNLQMEVARVQMGLKNTDQRVAALSERCSHLEFKWGLLLAWAKTAPEDGPA